MTDPIKRDPTQPPAAGDEVAPDDEFAPDDEAEDDDESEQYDADGNPVEDDEDESDYAAIAAEYTAERDPAGAAGGDSAIRDGRGNHARDRQSSKSGLSPSELAVHVNDRASAAFVVVVVAVFIGIFAYGLLAGVGGFLTPIRTPAPLPSVSAAPSAAPSSSVVPSAAPSASSVPSGSPAASAPSSPTPGSSGASPAASPSPSPSPLASPSS